MLKPQYILSLREFLPASLQVKIAEDLGFNYPYVRSVLGGNRGRDLKSARALEIARYVENYILASGLEYLPPLDYLDVALRIYARRGSEKAYSRAIGEVFPRFYSPVVGLTLNIFPN